jgi:hypothetical protein
MGHGVNPEFFNHIPKLSITSLDDLEVFTFNRGLFQISGNKQNLVFWNLPLFQPLDISPNPRNGRPDSGRLKRRLG